MALWIGWVIVTKSAWLKTGEGDEVLSKFGQFGDTFGSLNALFTGFAIIGVVFTLYRQHQDGEEDRQRHRANLDAQGIIARIDRLNTIVDQYERVIAEQDAKLADYQTLRGFQATHLNKFTPMEPFIEKVAGNYQTDGVRFVHLATKVFGDLRKTDFQFVWDKIENELPAFEQAALKLRLEIHGLRDSALDQLVQMKVVVG